MPRPLPTLALLLGLPAAAAGQTTPAPVVKVAPVVVEETALTADATGLTRVHLDPTAPATGPTLDSLAGRVANLHLNAGGAGGYGDLLSLRGLTNTPYFSDPSVTAYFDDLPLDGTFTYPGGLFGFTTATVLRGPQATAHGRGGEAGVILLASAEPGAHAGGQFRLAAGSAALRSAAFAVHSSHGGAADATVAGVTSSRHGFIQNLSLGTRVNDQEATAASARLRYRPSSTTELTLQLLGQRRRDGAQPLVPLAGPPFTVTRAKEGSSDSDFGGGALKAAFATPAGRLTATTSLTSWSLSPFENRLNLPPTIDSRIVQSQRTWNEEVRLISDPRSLVAWFAGAWFSSGRTRGQVNRAIPGLFPIEASTFHLRSRASAVFGEASVPPNLGWNVTAGLRIEDIRRDFERNQTVPAPGRFTAGRSSGAFLPKLSASYAVTNETTLAATLATGRKPGGWSAYTANPTLAGFRPERTTSAELGLDTAFARRTFTLAVRAFAYRIRDYQIERSFNASDYLVVNAPRARSLGGEMEALWRPDPELTLTATLGLTRVTLTRFTDPFTGRNLEGRRAPYAPDHDVHVAATWHPKSGWFASAEVAATGRIRYDEAETPSATAAARTLFGARTGWEAATWRLTAFAENLTDRRYAALIIPGVRHQVPGAPRTWGLEATLKW